MLGRMGSTGKSHGGHVRPKTRDVGLEGHMDTEITKDGEREDSVGHKDRDTKDGT